MYAEINLQNKKYKFNIVNTIIELICGNSSKQLETLWQILPEIDRENVRKIHAMA